MENSNDGVALLKGDKHIYVNRRFVEMFGYESPNDVVGKPLSIIVHPDDLALVADLAARRQLGEPVPDRYEYRCVRKDGTPLSIEACVKKILYLGEAVSLATLSDVTERKKSENVRSVLYDIAKAVNSTKTLDDLFNSIHISLSKIIDVTDFSIAFYHKEKDLITIPYRVDQKNNKSMPIENASRSETITAKVIRDKKTLFLKEEDLLKVFQSHKKNIFIHRQRLGLEFRCSSMIMQLG